QTCALPISLALFRTHSASAAGSGVWGRLVPGSRLSHGFHEFRDVLHRAVTLLERAPLRLAQQLPHTSDSRHRVLLVLRLVHVVEHVKVPIIRLRNAVAVAVVPDLDPRAGGAILRLEIGRAHVVLLACLRVRHSIPSPFLRRLDKTSPRTANTRGGAFQDSSPQAGELENLV